MNLSFTIYIVLGYLTKMLLEGPLSIQCKLKHMIFLIFGTLLNKLIPPNVINSKSAKIHFPFPSNFLTLVEFRLSVIDIQNNIGFLWWASRFCNVNKNWGVLTLDICAKAMMTSNKKLNLRYTYKSESIFLF